MLKVVEQISRALLRASGARSVNLQTSIGDVHGYVIEGRGADDFALLHGMGTTATSYTPVVRRLLPSARRVVLLDLPGHGRSPEPTAGLDTHVLEAGVLEGLDALLDHAGIARAVLLGTSLGGAAALGYALARPNRVRALVLASPAGAPLTVADLDELRARFDLKTRVDARRFLRELLHAPPFYLRAIEGGLVDQLSRPLIRGFLLSLDDANFFTEERLAPLVPPVTLLWGKSDRILPRSGLAFYRRALPAGTRVEELEGIGHSPHLERPDLVADRMRAAAR
ncbi:MAG: alpha/beta fold hydrolase [Polyangiaceae bacterium]